MNEPLKVIQGAKLDSFPLNGLEWFADILYLDGPLLSHYISRSENHYLYHWVDQNLELNRWMIYKVDFITLINYLRGEDDLYDLFWKNADENILIIDMNSNGDYKNILYVDPVNLPNDYIPKENHYYEMEIPEEYDSLLQKPQIIEEADYYSSLKSKAIYMNVSPRNSRHGTTVAIPEIVDFLKNFNASYVNFGEVEFGRIFSSKYKDPLKYQQALDQMREVNVLRSADSGFSSFGIALVSDFIVNKITNADDEVNKWLKALPNIFEDQVVKRDFNNPDQIKELEERYSPEQRAKFLSPYIKILENKKYKIAPANREFFPIGRTSTITKSVKDKLLTITSKEVSVEEEAVERELVTMVVEKKKGEDITRMSGKAIASRTLSSKPVTEFESEISSFEFKKQLYKLEKPVQLKTEFDGQYYLVVEPLTQTTSQDKTIDEAIKKIKEKLYRNYNRLTNMTQEFMTDLEMEELRKLQSLIDGATQP